MNKIDEEAVGKHIDILNVAYHVCLEIKEEDGLECKAICPKCGYNKLSKVPTLSLYPQTNKYYCCRCKIEGYSIGLYAMMRKLSMSAAYDELLKIQCFSQDREHVEISPINLLADIRARDEVYREFLGMLKLEPQHKKELQRLGFLNSSIDEGLFRTIPKNYIKRRIIGHTLAKKFNLSGIPGFFQEEDFKWCFNGAGGFYVPAFDQNGYIQGLSMHIDKPYNDNKDLWFSSNKKINGTAAKNWVMKYNIKENTDSVYITDDFILGHLIKETINAPIIAFQNISNSYMILKEIENTEITNIIFAVGVPQKNSNLDYIIRRLYRDLPDKFNIDVKYIENYKDFFEKDFDETFMFDKVS